MADDTTQLPEIVATPPDNNATPGNPTQASGTPPTGNTVQQTAESKNVVSNGDLPYAVVAMPTTSAGQSGIGNNKHSLQPETWVIGFFADGDNCQQPVITHVIPGGPGAGSGMGTDGVGGTGSGSSDSTGSSSSTTTPSSGPLTGDTAQNAQTVWNFFKNNGYTPEQVAGIMGNLKNESGFNPGAKNPTSGATGLGQWLGSRKTNLSRWPNNNTVEGQCAYILFELQHTESDKDRHLRNAKDVTAATIAFANFERFDNTFSPSRYKATGNGFSMTNSGLQKRIADAKSIYAQYNKPQSSAQASSGPGV